MSWAEVLKIFLRAAFLSVNGSTTLALLEADLVPKWLSAADYSTGVVVGAASPGPFGYGCIALGFLADGWRGALVATITSWLPAFLAIPLASGYRRLEGQPWIGGATWAVSATGNGLLVALVVGLALHSLTGPPQILIGAGVLALLFARVPAPLALAMGAAAGAIFLR